jgi:hypothetical protein
MSFSDTEKKVIDQANQGEKIHNEDVHIYKYDIGNNAHLAEGDMTHDFSKKIDIDKQIDLDLADNGKNLR